MREGISRATMGRLPEYLRYLEGLPRGTRRVSATAIARGLGLGEVQVRKDLASVCGAGKPKVGYDVGVLARSIRGALGDGDDCEAVIVGAGKLGTALLDFSGFADYGIRIPCAFDIHAERCADGVRPMEELRSYCTLHQVEVGILTVPPEAAQTCADLLVSAGVRAIFCLAPVRLTLPPGVSVRYENMALSLAHLCRRAKETETRLY
mgnify:FL=1